ncbi:glycosyltransferase family 4 protein [Novosphingobium aerophilum]|uniref:glycosyltransferase family 4 protein n=1 Tax=Novosphingobium aerophilum TaxID=2839843 RepID=UPI001BE3F984|nr:glycosyltransferase family 1 protein [Novosphingobium aerophilum]
MIERDYLIDVTRLVWRAWSGRLPTGIDRVCLAYLDHFGDRAQAVVQRGGMQRVFSPAASDRLFAAIRAGGPGFRTRLLRLLPFALSSGGGVAKGRAGRGPIYLNIGHTGLDEPSLPGWVRRNGLRAVFLVHDLIPITHPEFCRSGEAEKHRARMRNVLTCAAGIIGNSQSTLDELQAFAELEQLAVPPFVPAWISGHEIPDSAPPAAMDRPHFIVVGTIEGRKNHILLFQIWRKLVERLGHRAPRLVVIGQRGWEAEHALAVLDRNPLLRGHIRELGSASDLEAARLMAGARALLMPSFAEGFGLPVVEAMQLGTPVICTDLPAFREIAGDIPHYLDPLDGLGWESAILSFLEDCPDRMRQIRQLRGYRGPDWPSHFAVVEPWLSTL